MFTSFPSYKQIQSAADPNSAADPFSLDKAISLMWNKPTGFVPTMLPALDEVVASLSIPVVYDVPCIEQGEVQTCPYTNTKTGMIHMPHPQSFNSPEDYTHTLMHEVSHWIGQKLKRPYMDGKVGRPSWDMEGYATEEMTAELTALAFEQATGGKPVMQDWSLMYVRSYIDAPFAIMQGVSLPTPDPVARFNEAVKRAGAAVSYLLSHVKEPA